MKIGNLVKQAIKWAPVVYPVVKKILNNKKASSSTTTRRK